MSESGSMSCQTRAYSRTKPLCHYNSLRSPAQVEGTQGILPQPEKDFKSPSSTRLEDGFPYHDSRAMTRSPSPCAWTPVAQSPGREAALAWASLAQRGFSRAVAPVWGFSRGMTGSSGSLSCGAREVRCPCAWRGVACHCSRVMVGESVLKMR